MSDKFLVLANSKKKISERSSGDTGRCIAGIRIKDNGDCEWLRPIDPNTETGAIPIREANKYPLFSLVDVDIIGEDNHKKAYQYENKIVKLGTQKTKLSKENFFKILRNFKQESGSTILGVFPRDRISVEKQGYITGSLKIVAPKYIEFYKQDSTSGKPQIRCKFSFNNNSWWDIVVTDGYFINEYGDRLSYINNLKEQIYIVTSLGLPFNGYIYLLAACVFFLKDEYFLDDSKNNSVERKKTKDREIYTVLPGGTGTITVAVIHNKNFHLDKTELIDGLYYLKDELEYFNGKYLVKYKGKLYNPKDVHDTENGYVPNNGAVPVAIKQPKNENYTTYNISQNDLKITSQSISQNKNKHSKEELIRLKKEQEKQRKREDFRDNVGSFFGLIRIIITILFFIYGIIDGISDLFD